MSDYTSIFNGTRVDRGVYLGLSSYVPTLENAPSQSTTTFTLEGDTINFRVGQFCRVADSNTPFGYKFYQLYSLEDNGTRAVWSAYVTKMPPTYTAPTPKSELVYDGEDKALLNAGSTNDGTIQYSADGANWGTVIPSVVNAGMYTVYWRLVGDATHIDLAPTSIVVSVAKVVPTVVAPTALENLEYDGNEQPLTEGGETDYGTMQYSLDNVSWSTRIPKGRDAGSYTFYYRVLGDVNVEDTEPQSVSLTIAQRQITPIIILSQNTYTYDGNAKTPSVVVKYQGDEEQITVSPTEYSVSYSNNIGAGTATASVEDTNINFSFTGSTTFTIEKASGSVTTAPTDKAVTYSGSTQSVVNAGEGTGVMYYRLGTEGDFSTYIPTATNAGTYTLYYYAAESANYLQSATGSIDVTIAKAAPTYTAPTAKTLIYNGESQALLNAGSTEHGTFSYSADGETWVLGVIPEQTNADTYTVYWKLTGDSNHTDVAPTQINVTISKVTPTVTAPTAVSGLVYDSNPQTLLSAGSADFGTIKYSLDNSTWGTGLPEATNAGTYIAYYMVEGNSNINSVPSSSISVSIGKVTPTVTAPTIIENLVYDGSEQNLAESGSTNFGTMQYSVDGGVSWGTNIPKGCDAGIYTFYYRVLGDSNIENTEPQQLSNSISQRSITPIITLSQDTYTYNGGENTPSVVVKYQNEEEQITVSPTEYSVSYSNNVNAGTATVSVSDNDINFLFTGSTTFTIEKASGSVTTIPTNKAVTYSGVAQVVANAGEGTGTMYYRLGSTGDFTTSIPEATNAGTYTLYYYAAESGNYLQSATGSVEVTVAKALPTYTAPTAKSLTYNNESLELVNAGQTIHGTFNYSFDGDTWSVSIPEATNAGSYTVYWKLVGDSNHTDVSPTTISVTIAKVTPTVTSPTIVSGLVYDGTAQSLVSAGSTNFGTMKYSIDNETWSTSIPEATNANDYTVYYKVEGDGNINDVAAASVSVSIAKVTPTVTAPTANTLTYDGTGQVLASVGSVDFGTMQYSLDNTTYSTTMPSAVDANTYTVYYRVVGDSNVNDVTPSTISVVIDKASGSVTTSPSANTPTYNGLAQMLVVAGEGTGTMMYKLNDGEWGTSIPTATNADEYTVYFKAAESSNYYESASDSVTVTISKVNPTVTAPTAKVLTFNGSAQEVANEGSADFGTIQYKLDDGSYGTSMPTATNGGLYTLYYKVVGDSNINDVSEQSITCSINEKEVTATVELGQYVYTYSGSSFEPTVTVKDGQTVIDPSEYTVTYSNNTNAGTATATITDNTGGDYNVIGSATFTINKAVGYVSTAPTDAAPTYDATAQAIVVAGIGTGAMMYRLGESGEWGYSIPTATNAGEYTVYYKAAESSNYLESSASSVTASISKVTPTVTAPTAETLTYNGDAQELISAGSTDWGTVQYSLDGETYGTSVPTATSADDYTVYYRVVGDSNINDVSAAYITVTISKAVPTYTAPTAKTNTFDGTQKELLNAGVSSHGTFYYSYDNDVWSTDIPTGTNGMVYTLYWKLVGDSDHADIASTEISATISPKQVANPTITLSQDTYTYSGSECQPTPTVKDGNDVIDPSEYTVTYSSNTNVGTATCVITDKVGGSYDVSGSVTFTIEKANPAYTAPSAKSGLVYTGSAQDLINAGSTNDGTIQYSSDNSTWSTNIPSETNAGTYTLYWRLIGDSNHTDVSSNSVSCEISKANLSASVSMSGWTYGGTAQNPSVSGNSGNGSVAYSYKVNGAADSTYTSTKPSDANTYVVRAIISETSNYNGATVTNTFTISKASQTAPTATGASVAYGSTATATASGGGGQGSIEWSNGNTLSGNAGSSKTTSARWSGNSNYNASPYSNSVTLSIVKANQSAPSASGATTTYPTTATASASGGGGQGSIEWESSKSQTSVGSHTTRARWSGNSNYNASSWSSYVTVKMNKASRTISFTSAPSSVYTENTITVAASPSAGSGDGAVSYSSSNTNIATVSGSTVTGVAAGTCTIYATVAEGTNYTSASTSYTLTVSECPWVDLGLSVKWAKCNVGASYPYQSGYYFSWGNVSGKTEGSGYNFNPSNYSGTSGAGLTGNAPANSTYDGAVKYWGSPWRMPTLSEFTELVNNCTCTYTTQNSQNGMLFTSKKNNKSIFIPARGGYNGTSKFGENVQGRGWLSSYNSSTRACNIHFTTNGTNTSSVANREYGLPIRPVR